MKDARTLEVADKTCQVSYTNCMLGLNGAIFYQNMKLLKTYYWSANHDKSEAKYVQARTIQRWQKFRK